MFESMIGMSFDTKEVKELINVILAIFYHFGEFGRPQNSPVNKIA